MIKLPTPRWIHDFGRGDEPVYSREQMAAAIELLKERNSRIAELETLLILAATNCNDLDSRVDKLISRIDELENGINKTHRIIGSLISETISNATPS